MRVLGFNPPIVHMSLINDALKKAQKQRTGESASAAGATGPEGEAIGQIVKRDKPPAFSTLLVRIGLSASALLILLIGAYLGLQRSRQPTFQPAEPPPQRRPSYFPRAPSGGQDDPGAGDLQHTNPPECSPGGHLPPAPSASAQV